MVEDVAVAGIGSDLAPAHAHRAVGIPSVHDPSADVEVVDMLFDVEVAGEPMEVVPVSHLILHFGLVGLGGCRGLAAIERAARRRSAHRSQGRYRYLADSSPRRARLLITATFLFLLVNSYKLN